MAIQPTDLLRRGYIAAIVVLGVCCSLPLSLRAQSYTLTQRQGLASDLNNALAMLRQDQINQNYVSIIVPITDTSPIPLKGFDGECQSLSPQGAIIVTNFPDGTFMLQLITQESVSNVDVTPGSHQLVCDLNHWLWSVLGGKVYSDSIGDYVIGPHICYSSQKYFMGGTTTMTGRIVDSLRAGDGMSTYLGRSYSVYDGTNTLSKVGSDLFTDNRSQLAYIAIYLNHGTSDTTDDEKFAKSAFSELAFDKYSNLAPGSADLLQKITVEAQTQQYYPDCSDVNAPMQPEFDNNRVRLSVQYLTETTQLVKGRVCWKEYGADIDPYNNLQSSLRDSTNTDLWNFYDTSATSSIHQWCWFDIDEDGVLYFKVTGTEDCHGDEQVYKIFRVRQRPAFPREYCQFYYPLAGLFCVDLQTGDIMFKADPSPVPSCSCTTCDSMPVPCFDFCEKIPGVKTVDGVIAATAVTFSDVWPYEDNEFPGTGWNDNSYEAGTEGKWRPLGTFAYRSNTKGGTGIHADPNERNYADAGVFVDPAGQTTDAFHIFDWESPSSNDPNLWLHTDSVTMTSPFGEVIEQRDVLGVYSTAKFAYSNTMPKLVAHNARHESVDFESFEEWPFSSPPTAAHSGKRSYALSSQAGGESSDPIFTGLKITQQMDEQGLLVRAWVRNQSGAEVSSVLPVDMDVFPVRGFAGPSATDMIRVARSGEWVLYDLTVPASAISPGQIGSDLTVTFKNISTETIWVDDVRIQPLDAEMICYVYDPNTLRLITQFDDQHFGLGYQYDGEGKLVRKLKETERGMKTVAETQYHTPMRYDRSGQLVASIGPMGGSDALRMAASGNSGSGGSPSQTEQNSAGTKFDLLNLDLSPDGSKVKVLGSENPQVPDPEAILRTLGKNPFADSTLLAMPDVDKLKARLPGLSSVAALDSLRALDARVVELQEKSKTELSETDRARLDEEIRALRAERKKYVEERLGVSEEELRKIYRDLQMPESEPKSESKTEPESR